MKIKLLFILSIVTILFSIDKKVSSVREVTGTSFYNTLTMKKVANGTSSWTVITIDSCEYIIDGTRGSTSLSITHKGNCVYCIQRVKHKMF